MGFINFVPPVFTNVRQYGAVGDGVTDDSQAILAALSTIPTTGGGVLYLPPPYTYLTTAGLDISAYSGSLVIMGGGWASTLKLADGANTYLIRNTSGAQLGTRVCNLTLDCNGAHQTSASGGLYGYKYRRCLIDFVSILNPWQAGIFLDGAGGDFGYQNRISNCFIIGGMNTTSGTNAYGNGLRLVNTDENTVYANHFENNGNPNDGSYGFHIYDQNGLTDYSGNSFVNGMGVLKLDGLQCVVRGNRFDGNGGNAVQINASASDTLVSQNQVLNVGYRASGGSANSVNGIYLNATRCVIADNAFWSDTSATPRTNAFVKIDTGATYCAVERNRLNVRASSGTLTAPIYFASGRPTGCRVRDNGGFDSVNAQAIFVTENHGTASITSGTTSIAVSHGLALTPTVDQLMVTPTSSISAATRFWVSNPTSTQFTINVDSNPGATISFAWRGDVGY